MVTLQVKRNLKLPLEKSILKHAAEITLEAMAAENKEMSIVIGDDVLLRELNLKYRNVDATTDVLSFTSNELDPDTSSIYLGDVIISLLRAQEQASVEGYPLGDELQLLVVHGTLHLLGYDHTENPDKKIMQAAQDKILSYLKLNLTNTL